ncbi:meteorin-like protein [Narcine bancroftii]|uniref:meteorin-like protein n=1 Tax=Narcine bancroftii TaxID=1343680 RepID=UPI00383205B7
MLSAVLDSVVAVLLLCKAATSQSSSNQCSWKGSGLTHNAHSRDVEQVYLRCSKGSLEWLYPTGALRVNLRTNIASSFKDLTVCIKLFKDSKGANIYLEKTGDLKLLVTEEDHIPNKVYCFGMDQGALFIQATPQMDISRKITGFQYEFFKDRSAANSRNAAASCRPCNDMEVLLAACTSDLVVRGSIHSVTHDQQQEESRIDIFADKIYRQKNQIFQPIGKSAKWLGHIKTMLHCGVKEGEGDFLFTGSVHFGEVQLGCAPRYKDFRRIYKEARDKGEIPCELTTD